MIFVCIVVHLFQTEIRDSVKDILKYILSLNIPSVCCSSYLENFKE